MIKQTDDEIFELVEAAVEAAASRKALDTVVLDLREASSMTDYFVITSGRSERQMRAISEAIEEGLRELGARAFSIEGGAGGRWILLDYIDFVVHVFDEEAREFYDLEKLWRKARRVEIAGADESAATSDGEEAEGGEQDGAPGGASGDDAEPDESSDDDGPGIA